MWQAPRACRPVRSGKRAVPARSAAAARSHRPGGPTPASVMQTAPISAARQCISPYLQTRSADPRVYDPAFRNALLNEPASSLSNELVWSLGLQLAFELVEKAPIGAVGDDPLRYRFDEAEIMQSQRVEAQRVLWIVFAPFVIRDVAHCL